MPNVTRSKKSIVNKNPKPKALVTQGSKERKACGGKLEMVNKTELKKMVAKLDAQKELDKIMAPRLDKNPKAKPLRVDYCQAINRKLRRVNMQKALLVLGPTLGTILVGAATYKAAKNKKVAGANIEEAKRRAQQVKDHLSGVIRTVLGSFRTKMANREKVVKRIAAKSNKPNYSGAKSDLVQLEKAIRENNEEHVQLENVEKMILAGMRAQPDRQEEFSGRLQDIRDVMLENRFLNNDLRELKKKVK